VAFVHGELVFIEELASLEWWQRMGLHRVRLL
jgi:hypothetical protein